MKYTTKVLNAFYDTKFIVWACNDLMTYGILDDFSLDDKHCLSMALYYANLKSFLNNKN